MRDSGISGAPSDASSTSARSAAVGDHVAKSTSRSAVARGCPMCNSDCNFRSDTGRPTAAMDSALSRSASAISSASVVRLAARRDVRFAPPPERFPDAFEVRPELRGSPAGTSDFGSALEAPSGATPRRVSASAREPPASVAWTAVGSAKCIRA